MNELPRGWVKTELGKVTTFRKEKIDPTQFPDRAYIGMENVDGEKGLVSRDSAKNYKSLSVLFKKGDLIFGRLRPYLRKAVIPNFSGCASSEFIVFTENEALDNRFLRHVLRSSTFVDFANLVSTGDRPRVDAKKVAPFELSLPPKSEQRRIVEKVDSLLGRSTRARDELGHIPRLIERYKQAVLTKAFRGELTADWRTQNPPEQTASELVEATPAPQQSRGGRDATESVTDGRAALSVNIPDREAPDGWAWVSLRRVARQETGHTPSRKHPEYWDGDIPWIGIADANEHHGGIIEDTHQHVTQAGLDNSSARLLPAGTVCLSRTASVGYVVRMGRGMATSQDFVTWTCSDALDPEYLMFALLAEGDDIRRFGKGSTHKTIYFPEVRAFHICLAPLEEQKEIVRRVKAALAWIDRIAHEHENAAHLLSNLDQAVLAKAFRGELVPQDPDDEPASVLLERIRAERAKQPKAKRGRKKKEATA